jgi:hypothetical protein
MKTYLHLPLLFGLVVNATTTSKTFVAIQNIDATDWLAAKPQIIPLARLYRPWVNFINIIRAAFPPIVLRCIYWLMEYSVRRKSWVQNITNLACQLV